MPKRFKSKMYEPIGKGQKLVGRSTRWGNPFPVKGTIDPSEPPKLVQRYAKAWKLPVERLLCETDEEAVERFRDALLAGRLEYTVEAVRGFLRGFDLGCPCGAEACHADALLEVANAPKRSKRS